MLRRVTFFNIGLSFGNQWDHNFIWQIRRFSEEIQKIQPDIASIYNKLIDQSASTKPIPCNFVSQVIDYWGKNSGQLAIRCVDQENGKSENISYEEIVQRSHQIANFCAQRGLGKGSSVALMLGQRPSWWYSLAGLMRSGIAVVPCSRLLTSKDLLYRINHLGIQGIITTPELQSRVESIRKECPSLKMMLTTGPADNGWDSCDDIFVKGRFSSSSIIETTTADPCVYLYTSGTTGDPKAVQHNTDYLFFHWPTGRRWLRATPADIIYNASDTGWGFTVWITTATWAMGAKLLITPTTKKFNPEQMLSVLRDEKVTIFCAAPTVLRLLVVHPLFDKIDFPALKRIVTVGEALDETVIQRFAARGIEVAVGFGQAETPLIIGRVDDNPHVPNTMGQAISPYKVVGLDENFNPVSPGQIGQIALDLYEGKRGGLMRGYANAPERTQQVFSPDGRYYLTGDWATYLEGGFFAYAGRKDDLIKSRGYRIGPDEVEKAGMSHPAVAKIAVVGVRTSFDSTAITVKAFILLKPGIIESPLLIQEIQDHIKNETGPYKYPRLVECLSSEEWEKYETTSGKIRRVGLREREENKLKIEFNNENTLTPKL